MAPLTKKVPVSWFILTKNLNLLISILKNDFVDDDELTKLFNLFRILLC